MRCDWVRIDGPGRGPGDWQCRRCGRGVSMGYRHLHPEMYPDGLGECSKPQESAEPSAVGLLVRYGSAVVRWAAAGMPTRSDEEIERYYRRCLACAHYDAAGHRCRRCGCRVNADAQAWRNKIAMATERCPIGRWPDDPATAPANGVRPEDEPATASHAAAEGPQANAADQSSDGETAAPQPAGDAGEADPPHPVASVSTAPSALGAEAVRAEQERPALDAESLYRYFDRVYVINLHTRPDRLEAFNARLREAGWPFREPIVYPAIHGDTVGVPEEFSSGGGAYGCRMSHLRILQDCLMEGVQSVLVLEDDADVRPGFAAAVARFLARVPADWQGLMLGGQHHAVPDPTDDPQIVRVRNAQRTHAYAARRDYMRALQRRWGNSTVHIDWRMRDWQHIYRVYAPSRWLVGQAGGRSDIAGREKPAEWWNRADPALPVVVLRAPREVFEELLSGGGWHGGRRRDRQTGYDVGLPPCADPTLSAEERSGRLRRWIECVGGEAEEMGAVCVLWHPGIRREQVAAAWGGPVVELEAATADEARRCLPAWIAATAATEREPKTASTITVSESRGGVMMRLSGNVGWGNIGFDGKLGYKTELGDAVCLPTEHNNAVIVSAHAPSTLEAIFDQPTAIAAAANVTFDCTKPVRAWINDHCIGVLRRGWDATDYIHVPPGEYRLRLEHTGDNHVAHTVWCMRKSDRPQHRVALITVGAYRDDYVRRLRYLFASAAKQGMLLHVSDAHASFTNLYEYKIARLKRFIVNLPQCYTHIAFVDAEDCFIQSAESDLVEALSTLTISAEDCSWPVQTADWQERFPSGTHRYPNAGCFGGPRDAVVAALTSLSDLYDELRRGDGPRWADRKDNAWTNPEMDQFLWQIAMIQKRFDIVLDTEWRLCACVTCTHKTPTDNDHFNVKGGRLVLADGTSPPFVHVSGPGKPYLGSWASVFGLVELA